MLEPTRVERRRSFRSCTGRAVTRNAAGIEQAFTRRGSTGIAGERIGLRIGSRLCMSDLDREAHKSEPQHTMKELHGFKPAAVSVVRWNTVLDRSVSPGRNSVDGNRGSLGLFGKCSVSIARPSDCRIVAPVAPTRAPLK